LSANWFFPEFNGGKKDGISDPGILHFAADPLNSFVRECIQNSIDARMSDAEPVRVVINLHEEFPINNIPGWDKLRSSLVATVTRAKQLSGAAAFNTNEVVQTIEETIEAIDISGKIDIFEFSDFNTKGLAGAGEEEKNSENTPFYRLLFEPGSNDASGPMGGLFGLGKFAPFSLSALRTVLYSTVIDEKKANSLFIGKTILAHHEIKGKSYMGTGYYGQRVEGYNVKPVDSYGLDFGLSNRRKKGTSLFVLAPKIDEKSENVLASIIENYFAAIFRKQLVVDFGGKILDDSNLVEHAKKHCIQNGRAPAIQEFIEALKGKPIVFDHPDCGQFSLYVNRLNSRGDAYVYYMRKPLQKVNSWRFGVEERAACVFIASDEKSNKVFAKLENPQHDSWKWGEQKRVSVIKGHTIANKWAGKELNEILRGKLEDGASKLLGKGTNDIIFDINSINKIKYQGNEFLVPTKAASVAGDGLKKSDNLLDQTGAAVPGSRSKSTTKIKVASTPKNRTETEPKAPEGKLKKAPKQNQRPPAVAANPMKFDDNFQNSESLGGANTKLNVYDILQRGRVPSSDAAVYLLIGKLESDAVVSLSLRIASFDEQVKAEEDNQIGGDSLNIVEMKNVLTGQPIVFAPSQDGFFTFDLPKGPVKLEVATDDSEFYRVTVAVK
jgi:hypothetical protein